MTTVEHTVRWLLMGCVLLTACGEDEPPPRRSAPVEEATFVPIAGGVGWIAGEPLLYRQPTNEMRTAEYIVRDHPGVVLAVSYFPPEHGGGGEVRRNVDRWLGQIRRDPRESPRVESRTVNDLPVTIVDTRGAFVGRRGTGGGGDAPRAGWRLLGAIVEAEDGLVFFKLTGPEAGVDAAAAAFDDLVRSIHPE